MRIHGFFPPAAAVLALALGFMTIGAPSPAYAQDEGRDQKSEPRVEKKIIRIMDDQDEERGGDAGYLGVQVQELTSALRRAKNIPGSIEGALVNSVQEDGPAAKAGIKMGDVILEVNQRPTVDPSELIDVVRGLKPGTSVKVVLHRTGTRKTFFVTIGSRPDDDAVEMTPPALLPPGGWGDRNPDVMRLRLETMRRHHDEMQRQLEDIRDEIAQLRREIRALRSELRGR
jgi:C-terminal processing protease CtpA/Prc